MLQIIPAILGLLIAYLVPGLSVSFAIFPYETQLSVLERIALSVSLSSSITAFSMLLSNWFQGGFESPFIVGLQITLMAASWAICWRQRALGNASFERARTAEDHARTFTRPVLWLFGSAAVFIMFFRFYNGLLFPITNWDSLTEFAYLGRLYFTEGRIPIINGATLGIGSSANYPPLVILLYTWFYYTSGGINEILARAVSPIFSLLTVIVTYNLAKETYKSKALAMSSLFFLVTVPIFIFISEECLSDIVVTSISLSAIYFLYLGLKRERYQSNRYILVSGLLAGVAAFTKYTGLVFLVIGCVLILTDKLRDIRHPSSHERVGKLVGIKLLGIFFIGFIIFGAPWYLRNLIVLGNPVYPLLYRIFGGKEIDVWMMKNSWDAHFSLVQTQNSLSISFQDLLLTYYTVFFRFSPYELLDLGPFLGAFFVIGTAFSIRRRERPDIFLLVLAFSYLSIWRLGFGIFLRYLSMILPVLAIISARGLTCVYEAIDSITRGHSRHNIFTRVNPRVWLKTIIFIVLFEGFLLPSTINGIRGYKTWDISSPFTAQETYLETRFQGTWDTIEFLSTTPTNATILTYDHSLAYYVNRQFIFSDESRVKGIHLAQSVTNVSSILASLNVSYVVITTLNEKYFPLLKASYFYMHLDDGIYAQLILDKFPSKVYVIKH